MSEKIAIELLAPAKNAETGKAAVVHGADAVYIGAPKFGARSAAGNSVEDIADLVTFAHRYDVRIYVALNTILKDEELAETERLIWQLYDAGVDALIIQDMGIFEMNLPPIALHASTQCNNRTLEKVQFLEQCGFEQVVLARELSLEQIKHIAENTNVKLESFVHGALCVSYSGQCYLSEASRGRSANRGECAQMCRLPYSLVDADGNVIVENKHLLSLKDFEAAPSLCEMLDAGVTSFKIEGRLKDVSYVKNVTAFYRQKLDKAMQGTDFVRSSSGFTKFYFEPNPHKSFFRGSSDYFLHGRPADLVNLQTPKSVGEEIGKIKFIRADSFDVDSNSALHNGDGLCYFDEIGDLKGIRVNRVEGNRVFPFKMPRLQNSTVLYRNNDFEFDKVLSGDKSAVRKIPITVSIAETEHGFRFVAKDAYGISATLEVEIEKQPAQNKEKVQNTFETQLAKLGDTEFELDKVVFLWSQVWFVPVSVIADWRRQLVELMRKKRQKKYPVQYPKIEKTSHPYPESELDYRANVMNAKAKMFYKRHGATVLQPAFERVQQADAELMRTKYCIKFQLGLCPKQHPQKYYKEPLFLVHGSDKFQLTFDCAHCEMVLTDGR